MTKKKTKIINLTGGLGNQMFQYAYGICLKNKSNDIRLLYRKTRLRGHNGFELEKIFKLKVKTYFWIEGFFLLRKITKYTLKPVFKKIQNILQSEFQAIHFGKIDYLVGNRNEIITAFTFPKLADAENLKIAEKIKNTHSVSIHIRLGDYLNTNFINLSKTDYYLLAVEAIKRIQAEKGQNDLTFFIFSDEVDKCREKLNTIDNLTAENCHFVNCNQGRNAFKDMQLMSLCQHNIIANSTFSFWGAYLNQNKDKIVICPKSHVQYDKKYIIINQQNISS